MPKAISRAHMLLWQRRIEQEFRKGTSPEEAVAILRHLVSAQESVDQDEAVLDKPTFSPSIFRKAK
jgi:hypothetical protein